jgi:ATP-dependent Clp protease protease subunit
MTVNNEVEEVTEESDELQDGLFDFAQLQGQEVWTPQTLTYYGPNSRTILIAGEIDEGLSNSVISQLFALDEADKETPITIYINTHGGEVGQALAMYDIMRSIGPQIITIAMGNCMSAGLLLLQAGDVRVSMPNARLMYHEPISEGQALSQEGASAFVSNYIWAKDTINGIIKQRSKISNKNWEKYFDGKTAFYFNPPEALKIGLIDHITDYKEKSK